MKAEIHTDLSCLKATEKQCIIPCKGAYSLRISKVSFVARAMDYYGSFSSFASFICKLKASAARLGANYHSNSPIRSLRKPLLILMLLGSPIRL